MASNGVIAGVSRAVTPIHISQLKANGVKVGGNTGLYAVTTDLYIDTEGYTTIDFDSITIVTAGSPVSAKIYDANGTALYTATSSVSTAQTVDITNTDSVHFELVVAAQPDAGRYAIMNNIVIS